MRAIILAAALLIGGVVWAVPQNAICLPCLWKSACYNNQICSPCICVKSDSMDLTGFCASR